MKLFANPLFAEMLCMVCLVCVIVSLIFGSVGWALYYTVLAIINLLTVDYLKDKPPTPKG